jgi:hypothetical protein
MALIDKYLSARITKSEDRCEKVHAMLQDVRSFLVGVPDKVPVNNIHTKIPSPLPVVNIIINTFVWLMGGIKKPSTKIK